MTNYKNYLVLNSRKRNDDNNKREIAKNVNIPFPPWMFRTVEPDQLKELVSIVQEEKRRIALSKAAVVGGAATCLSIGVLGHMYLTTNNGTPSSMSDFGVILQEWFENLDDDIKNLVRCTAIAAYQVERDQISSVVHNMGVSSVGHGIIRPVVEDTVLSTLQWGGGADNVIESFVAEGAGLGIVQGYFVLNDIRKCKRGELTYDERNVSVSKRVGIFFGAAVGQTMALPAGETAFLITGAGLVSLMGPALAAGPAVLVGSTVVGGSVWLGSTILGGVLGSKAGEKSYRTFHPENRVKDARIFFFGSDQCHPQTQNLNADDVERVYRTKVKEIEIAASKISSSKKKKSKSKEQKYYNRCIFQANRHLAWLLEGYCPNALAVLGIEKASVATPLSFESPSQDFRKVKSKQDSWKSYE